MPAGVPRDPRAPKLTPERVEWLNQQVLDFLDKKNILDTDLLRMPTMRFTRLRAEFAAYVLSQRVDFTLTQEMLAEYLGFTEVTSMTKMMHRVLSR